MDPHSQRLHPHEFPIWTSLQGKRGPSHPLSSQGTSLAIVTIPANQPLKELYTERYEDIDWPAQRNNVAAVDIYSPHTKILNCLNLVLGAYESCSLPPLRRATTHRTYELIVMEDDNTDCQCLGPVNKMMNQISRWYMEGSESPAVKKHHDRNLDFMWMGSDGMRMCGTNGSQLWDIAFIAQALAETGLALEEENRESMMRALEWIERNQMTDTLSTSQQHTERRRKVLGHSAPKPEVILSVIVQQRA